MAKTILFSPVGGTDPMPQTNWKDGSLLHIARVYKPDVIYLYMSAEILENHKKDNRYLYCLEKLAELQNRKTDFRIIERESLKDVHLFDYFYEDFRKIIKEIADGMDETDKLILNISSGTPAMKSGLLVLATLSEYPFIPVQVETPMGKMNEHRHENYDVELMWEGNEDNEENFTNRCKEISCPSLTEIKQEEIIKKLVAEYDYKAALSIANGLSKNQNYLPLLELANARLQMNLPKVNELLEKTNANFIPMKSADKQKYFEYALNMDIKRKKGEYVDFVRAITPLIADLFALILKNMCKIDIRNITELNAKNAICWSKNKLKENYPKLDSYLNSCYSNGFKYEYVKSDALLKIINEYASDDKIKKITASLRSIEEDVRNKAAHEIVSISDKAIRNKTGFTSEEIMKLIKDAFKYSGLGITQKHWDSYDDMNKAIIKAIG